MKRCCGFIGGDSYRIMCCSAAKRFTNTGEYFACPGWNFSRKYQTGDVVELRIAGKSLLIPVNWVLRLN